MIKKIQPQARIITNASTIKLLDNQINKIEKFSQSIWDVST